MTNYDFSNKIDNLVQNSGLRLSIKLVRSGETYSDENIYILITCSNLVSLNWAYWKPRISL